MFKYKVWSLDVWGNEVDGYETNDRANIGTVELENVTDQSIIQALLDSEYLNSFGGKINEVFTIDGDDFFITIDSRKTGKPLFTLELEENCI